MPLTSSTVCRTYHLGFPFAAQTNFTSGFSARQSGQPPRIAWRIISRDGFVLSRRLPSRPITVKRAKTSAIAADYAPCDPGRLPGLARGKAGGEVRLRRERETEMVRSADRARRERHSV